MYNRKNFRHTNTKINSWRLYMEKHLIITASSKVSWKDAITKAIEEASKTIDYLSSVKVLEQKAKINMGKIEEYFVDLDISFTLDRNRN